MDGPDPLDRFIEIYEQMRASSWRTPAIESRPRASKRVLALARTFSPGGTWSDAIEVYLQAFRLAVRTGASMPVFGPRTTLWTLSSPEAVRRLSGALAITPADLHRWEEQVLWLRLPPETLAALRAAAAHQGRSAPGLAAQLVEEALDRLTLPG
jgi:hypothetical protein